MFIREKEFANTFFKHSDWEYTPKTFQLDGTKYTPDFYDRKRDTFIEVAGTRQAYSSNKHKYALFRYLYPNLNLEVRRADGTLIVEKYNGSGAKHLIDKDQMTLDLIGVHGLMKLERYIELLKLNRSEAARQMRISRVQLTNVLNERKKPGITFMRKAIEWSKGAVTLHDFLD